MQDALLAVEIGRDGRTNAAVSNHRRLIRPPQAVWIIREIAPITRSNCEISTLSCFLPAAVNV